MDAAVYTAEATIGGFVGDLSDIPVDDATGPKSGLVQSIDDIPRDQRSRAVTLREAGAIVFGKATGRQPKTFAENIAQRIEHGVYIAYRLNRQTYIFDVKSLEPCFETLFLPGENR